jgi:hypothetical protein
MAEGDQEDYGFEDDSAAAQPTLTESASSSSLAATQKG